MRRTNSDRRTLVSKSLLTLANARAWHLSPNGDAFCRILLGATRNDAWTKTRVAYLSQKFKEILDEHYGPA